MLGHSSPPQLTPGVTTQPLPGTQVVSSSRSSCLLGRHMLTSGFGSFHLCSRQTLERRQFCGPRAPPTVCLRVSQPGLSGRLPFLFCIPQNYSQEA